MKGWKILSVLIIAAMLLFMTGSVFAQYEEEEDPLDGLFDLENSELEVVLEWESLEMAKLKMSMELDLGEFAAMMRGMLDSNEDGEVEEDELGVLGNLFEDEDPNDAFLGLDILVDNESAQTDSESGWTGLVGPVDSEEPIGMYATVTFEWTIDDSLDRHRITLRPIDDEDDEEWEDDDINWTDDDDDEWEDDDDDEMPFNMTFLIKFPSGWEIDLETVEPEMMKQFVNDDGHIELTPDNIETIGEPEGDIVTFEVVKTEDSPFPFWIPVGALLIGSLSIGLLRRRRH